MKLVHLVRFITKEFVTTHGHVNDTTHGHVNVTTRGHMNVTTHGHMNVKKYINL